MFNARPYVQTIALPGGHHCLVVDNALAEPERWRTLASKHAAQFFVDPHAGYPVRRLELPGPVLTAMDVFFSETFRDRMGFRRVVHGQGWLSLATAAAATPSRASSSGSGQGIGVMSLCLFDDPGLGGMVFPASLFPGDEPPLRVEARYNRLMVFDGASWHAPDIPASGVLADDPAQGRLSLDARFTCRRRLA
ncbi:DUF6445 family protein [Arenimonas donghaensis]|uniref:Prolyl 4-hydroxylase alpha subunit Fe(2+) 2OG dioxygenase domain-containing protein n=1 Tax=Arenimonas donghaensis DSM 18148 = HO3-R19 TaxID=1121014 RepID=A0A087MKF5_9GAMM|nr:DUF6445 family protein [Arenimonas donghaensis]KFL37358.1 hypothetical protein N788_10180 [Arenimonas donghaensis DSM 18148 = HO3-R19]